jgi:hypothetical protein
LRGSGNTAAMVKMVKSLAQAKYLASAWNFTVFS